jgi:hypothetical protein
LPDSDIDVSGIPAIEHISSNVRGKFYRRRSDQQMTRRDHEKHRQDELMLMREQSGEKIVFTNPTPEQRAEWERKIKSRTHDEITGRPILPKDRLLHGHYYKGRCRNATVARWNADKQCFFHWREKFGNVFIETIKYPTDETEPWWDTFDVVEELTHPRLEIPFDVDAAFTGKQDHLYEYNAEMWGKPKSPESDAERTHS